MCRRRPCFTVHATPPWLACADVAQWLIPAGSLASVLVPLLIDSAPIIWIKTRISGGTENAQDSYLLGRRRDGRKPRRVCEHGPGVSPRVPRWIA